MRYKQLGNTDLRFSAVSAGTWQLGGANWGDVSREESIKAIRAMVENGATTVDTAPIYGFGNAGMPENGYGNGERIVGEAIEGIRDKVQLVTKCALKLVPPAAPGERYTSTRDMSRQEIISGCEASLRRLKTDYVDLLFIHWPDGKTPLEEVCGALETLIRDGKIRHYGLSNFTVEDTLKAHSMVKCSAVQLQYSMVNRNFEDVLKTMHEQGIGTMTYGSLGSGILSGKYRTLPQFAPGDLRITFYDYFKEPKFSRIMKLLEKMDQIALERNVPVSHVALNWTVQKDFVDTAICGVSKVHHAVENCAAMEWSLTEEEMAMLDKAVEEYA